MKTATQPFQAKVFLTSLHRQLGTVEDPKAQAVWEIVDNVAKEALKAKARIDADWKQRESVKIIARNAKAKRPKSAAEITRLCAATFDEKLHADREGLKKSFLKAFSPAKTKRYCSLSPDALRHQLDPNEPKVTYDIEVSSLRYALATISSAHSLASLALRRIEAKRDLLALLGYSYHRHPRTRRRAFDDIKQGKVKMPLTNCGQCVKNPFRVSIFYKLPGHARIQVGAAWTEFDKSAFKRAAEEVFKYQLRSDERDG